MLHALFSSNRPVVLAILAIPAVLFGVYAYTNAAPAEAVAGGPLFDLLEKYVLNIRWIHLSLGMAVNIFGAIVLNRISNRHEYCSKENYFPGLLYFFFVSLDPQWIYLNPLSISNVLIFLAVRRLLAIHRVQDTAGNVFDAGIILGLATLFFPPLIVAVPLIWLSLGQLRTFSFREWLIPISGFIIPFIYAVVYYWWYGLSLNYDEFTTQLNPSWGNLFGGENFVAYGFIAFSILLSFIGLGRFISSLSSSTVNQKNTRIVFMWMSFILLILYGYISALSIDIFESPIVMAAQFSIFGSIFFLIEKRKKIISALFYIWLIGAIAVFLVV
ncbi:MAG: hypothetical protein ABR574_01855 [Cryomorphaceae bacterium]|nr:hypothetical protein [Flavobacteriales bacterium]